MGNTGIRNVFIVVTALLLAVSSGGCGKAAQSYLAAAGGAENGDGTGQEAGSASSAGSASGDGTGEAASEACVLLVYICGEVAEPGVYELAEGSRIYDAVEAAGGMTEAAAREYWNLAEPLTDGQMVCFPTEKAVADGQVPAGAQQAGSPGITADGRVNINTAGLKELMTIPGVGQTRGEAILAYRQEHGNFQSPQDIKKVSGIGDTLYERMSGSIAVE